MLALKHNKILHPLKKTSPPGQYIITSVMGNLCNINSLNTITIFMINGLRKKKAVAD